jgi:hypothetical protein
MTVPFPYGFPHKFPCRIPYQFPMLLDCIWTVTPNENVFPNVNALDLPSATPDFREKTEVVHFFEFNLKDREKIPPYRNLFLFSLKNRSKDKCLFSHLVEASEAAKVSVQKPPPRASRTTNMAVQTRNSSFCGERHE